MTPECNASVSLCNAGTVIHCCLGSCLDAWNRWISSMLRFKFFKDLGSQVIVCAPLTPSYSVGPNSCIMLHQILDGAEHEDKECRLGEPY